MLQTRRGTTDGFTTQQYSKGTVYDVRDNLAGRFLQDGYAFPCRSDGRPKIKSKSHPKNLRLHKYINSNGLERAAWRSAIAKWRSTSPRLYLAAERDRQDRFDMQYNELCKGDV